MQAPLGSMSAGKHRSYAEREHYAKGPPAGYNRRAFMVNPFVNVYFIPGIAAGEVVVAVDVIVEVTADCGSGFGASCF